ncbi:caspase family protein [Chroococcidiopsis sp. TS-821]|uniref:caspase family protein n=1 Tax=Chroococcidiopsis sp. TS-821 TaxID=1378066 RepID=UPI000CEDC7DB|nr:caspase family protein [Chroococcidiopsis sp. TS-821]
MAKFALLIGVSHHGTGFNTLPGAVKDVEEMQRVLQNPGLEFDEVETLKDPEPLVMQAAIEDLFRGKARQSNDLVLLYYSGYCIKDYRNQLSFATSHTSKNTHRELIKSTVVSASFVQDIMNDSRATQQILILDCCFTQASAASVAATMQGGASEDIATQLGGNRTILLSSATQSLFQQKGNDISTYTRYLVEGLKGAADLDGDRQIAVDELHEYISRKVEATAANIEPVIINSTHNKILIAPVLEAQPQQSEPFVLPTRRTRVFAPLVQHRSVRLLLGVSFTTLVTLVGATYILQRQHLLQLPFGNSLVAAPRDYSQTAQTRLDHSKTVWSLATTHDGQTLVSSSGDTTIKIWHLPSGKPIRTLSGHTAAVWSVAITPDGRSLVSGSGDQTIKVWNLQTGELIRTLTGVEATVWAVAISQDGKTLVSADSNNTIKVWDLPAGKLLRSFAADTTRLRTIALSPDGQTLASGGQGQDIKIWDVNTGQLIRTLAAHKSKIITVAISPDGETLASGSNDETVEIWNIRTGRLVRTLHGHTDHVNSVAISADGQFLVSGAEDREVKLWSLRTGRLLHTFQGHPGDVYAVAISPDDQTVISGDKEGQIKFWR